MQTAQPTRLQPLKLCTWSQYPSSAASGAEMDILLELPVVSSASSSAHWPSARRTQIASLLWTVLPAGGRRREGSLSWARAVLSGSPWGWHHQW